MRPEAELRRESSGREQWVFRASSVTELLGVHAEQVGQLIQHGETVLYLLYSPRWEGKGGPFGIRAEPASHALAVTDRRFIVSRDTHSAGVPPVALSIPFEGVLFMESGTALMLAWTVIHFADSGSPRSATVLHRAIGHHHFAAAIRAYRSQRGGNGPALGARPVASLEALNEVEERHRDELAPLLIPSELPLAAAAWPALYTRQRRRRHECRVSATPAGAVIGTTHGVLFASDDPHTPPGSPNFGVNVVYVAPDAVRTATLVDRTTSGPFIVALQLQLARGDTSMSLEVVFPGAALSGVQRTLGVLAGPSAMRQIDWSS